MEDALQEPVRMNCGRNAIRIRQCFYRTRQYCDSWGDDRFMFLRFRIDGTELVIDRHPDPELVRRRYKIRALREVVSYALSRGLSPSSEQAD
jgi:hypothetical protein